MYGLTELSRDNSDYSCVFGWERMHVYSLAHVCERGCDHGWELL